MSLLQGHAGFVRSRTESEVKVARLYRMHVFCKIAVFPPFVCVLHQFRSRQVSITVKGIRVFSRVRKNLRKSSVSFVVSVHPPVLMQQLCPHWTDYREKSILEDFSKIIEKI